MNVHMQDAEHAGPLKAGRLVRSGPNGISAAAAGAAVARAAAQATRMDRRLTS
jgi:hypothetical protein